MIPFAILSGKIKTQDIEKEIRILELSPESFTFRLLKRQANAYVKSFKEAGQQSTIVLSFFQFKKRVYQELTLTSVTDIKDIEVREIEEETDFDGENSSENKQLAGLNSLCFELVVTVKNEDYKRYAEQLNQEYMRYVYLKLEETDAGLSQALLGYPAEKETIFSSSLEKQRTVWGLTDEKENWEKQNNGTTTGQFEKSKNENTQDRRKSLSGDLLGIELDNPAWYQAYLEFSFCEFVALYWKSSRLSAAHPLTKMTPKYLYIGNAYCLHLFPDERKLYQMLEKAIADSIHPVLVFAPVEEKDMEKQENRIKQLAKWCNERKIQLELVVNDWGMLGWLRQNYQDQFQLTLGILLSKQRRDPRIDYLKKVNLGQGPMNASFYQSYLKAHFGITRVSLQSCGYDQKLPALDSGIQSTIHFPFFQMNTSGWCPLLAMRYRKDRARQKAVISCKRECMEDAFLYPDFLKMTGRYNTIFGYDDSFLKAIESLQEQDGIQEIKVRFVAGFLNEPMKFAERNQIANITKMREEID